MGKAEESNAVEAKKATIESSVRVILENVQGVEKMLSSIVRPWGLFDLTLFVQVKYVLPSACERGFKCLPVM